MKFPLKLKSLLATHLIHNHGLGILYEPTDEEVEKLEKELANRPNRHQHGPGPGFIIVRFTRYGKAGDKES